MRLKTLLQFSLLYALTLGASAQVQLGGHIYVPSSTDSTNGVTAIQVVDTSQPCNLYTGGNCLIDNGSAGPDAKWTGTLEFNSGGVDDNSILLPVSPGRFYTILNNLPNPMTVQGWSISAAAPIGSVTTIPGNSYALFWANTEANGGITTDVGYVQIEGGGLQNGTPNIALSFPEDSTINVGPSYTDSYWSAYNIGCIYGVGNTSNSYSMGMNGRNYGGSSGFCMAVNSPTTVASYIQNQSSDPNAMTLFNVINDDITDGGYDASLTMGITSSTFNNCGGYNVLGALCTRGMTFYGASGGPLDFYSISGPNGLDPVIHFQYNANNKAPDDAHIDSDGFHIDDAAPPSGTTCATISSTGLIGYSSIPCGPGSGITISNLVSGSTVTCGSGITCSSTRGTLVLTTGVSTAPGNYATITFGTAYAANPVCLLIQSGEGTNPTAFLDAGATSVITTSFDLGMGGTPLPSSTYAFVYNCQP